MNKPLKHLQYSGLLLAALVLLLGVEVNANPMTLGITSNLDVVELYFKELALLQKEEKWKEIITLGEKALQRCHDIGDIEKEFLIVDQLVSTYFRLGNFVKAKEEGEHLILLGEKLKKPEFMIDSLYKLSAGVRGIAGGELDPSLQAKTFNEARKLASKALEHLELYCRDNKALKARVLFNLGAAICDDPHQSISGDFSVGISCYKEAIALFTELKEIDYLQRTYIRLGKAYLLEGNYNKTKEMIELACASSLERRTKMHLYFLEAQVLQKEGQYQEGISKALLSKELAVSLDAREDLQRFDHLLNSLELELALDKAQGE